MMKGGRPAIARPLRVMHSVRDIGLGLGTGIADLNLTYLRLNSSTKMYHIIGL